jgi:hypothetical protein
MARPAFLFCPPPFHGKALRIGDMVVYCPFYANAFSSSLPVLFENPGQCLIFLLKRSPVQRSPLMVILAEIFDKP